MHLCGQNRHHTQFPSCCCRRPQHVQRYSLCSHRPVSLHTRSTNVVGYQISLNTYLTTSLIAFFRYAALVCVTKSSIISVRHSLLHFRLSHMAVHHHLLHYHRLHLFLLIQSFILNLQLGSSANPFLPKPFPIPPD